MAGHRWVVPDEMGIEMKCPRCLFWEGCFALAFSCVLLSKAPQAWRLLLVSGILFPNPTSGTFKGGAPTVSVLRVFYTALPCALALLPVART